MMLSAWFFVAWFILRGASAMRPSALQRMYTLIWLFSGCFALLVLVTILAQDYQIAGGYFVMFYFAAIFFALCISYFELFFAPSKAAYVARFDSHNASRRNSAPPSRPLTGSTNGPRSEERPLLDDDATETTSLLRGNRRTFAHYGSRHSISDDTEGEEHQNPANLGKPYHDYHDEQKWSASMPNSIWIVQFLLLVPITVMLVGQIALLLTSALYQTPQDGGSSLTIYIAFAVLSTLLLAPTGPFIHRFTYHIPTFLFFICIGTMIYNLVAFPFSRDHRIKVYFVQQIDLDTGANTASLTGLNDYVQRVASAIPSAQGQQLNCTTPEVASRKNLVKCGWTGLPAHVVPKKRDVAPYSNKTHTSSWVDYSISTTPGANNATIRVRGENTRACRILFDTPVSSVAIEGAALDPRFNTTGEDGSTEIRLWHREWSRPWNVSISWDPEMIAVNGNKSRGLSGKVVCLWSDANKGEIPAWDEVVHYLPNWAVATKYSDGLVEGSKGFEIE
jgi:hypothetical protein